MARKITINRLVYDDITESAYTLEVTGELYEIAGYQFCLCEYFSESKQYYFAIELSTGCACVKVDVNAKNAYEVLIDILITRRNKIKEKVDLFFKNYAQKYGLEPGQIVNKPINNNFMELSSLTYQMKLLVLEEVLNELEKDYKNDGLCSMIAKQLCKYFSFKTENILEYFPEVLKQKPTNSCGFWWMKEEKAPRIKAIKAAIEQIKLENNIPCSQWQTLFNYLKDECNFISLMSNMQEIKSICDKIEVDDDSTPMPATNNANICFIYGYDACFAWDFYSNTPFSDNYIREHNLRFIGYGYEAATPKGKGAYFYAKKK